MGFRVNRAELLQVLNRVQPGLSTRDFIEQSSSFVFQNGWVITYNEEISCRTKTGFPPELSGAVRAAQLLQVLENIGDDDVEIEVTAAELQVRANRKKSGIRMEAEIVLPLEQVEVPDEWHDLPENFEAAVLQVAGAAGTNDEEFMTVCIHMHPQYLEASDRRQVSRYMLECGIESPFLVRAASIAHIKGLGLTRIGVTDNWVHFRNKTLAYSCRRHLGDYPTDAITKMMDFRGAPASLPRGGVEAAKLGAVFVGDVKENDKVGVRLADGHMSVRGEGAFGWASADMDTTYKGPPVSFRIPPATLAQLITDHKTCEISQERLIVRGERWTFLTVLGRGDDAAPAAKLQAETESEPASEFATADADGGDE